VDERAAQPELEPRLDVGGGPVGRPVGDVGLDGALEGAVRVLCARPDVALVQMGVEVDEAGPDLPALQRDAGAALRRGAEGGDGPSLSGSTGGAAASRLAWTRASFSQ
jgi:hypothetical protein